MITYGARTASDEAGGGVVRHRRVGLGLALRREGVDEPQRAGAGIHLGRGQTLAHRRHHPARRHAAHRPRPRDDGDGHPGRSGRSPLPLMRAWAAGGLPGLGREPGEGTFQMIEAQRLSKRYGGKAAVGDLSFTVRPGHVTGFLGPNGAGKPATGSASSLPAECDCDGLLYVALEGGRPGACRRWHALLVIVVDDDGLAVPVRAGVSEGLEPDDSAVVASRGAAG